MPIDFSKYGEPIDLNKSRLDLSKYGTPIEIPETPEEEGVFKNIYKSLFSPVVNLVARPGQAVQALTGNEVSTGKFLGLDVTEPRNAKDILKDIGRGLETVSLGIGGTGARQAIKTGFKEGLKRGAKEGAIVGLKSSPVFGVGSSLSSGETDIKNIIKDTALATAVGVPSTALLGGIGGGISNVSRKFGDKNIREQLGSIYRETSSKYVKPQAILDQSELVKKTDPIAVLQMYGKNTLPEMKGGGANTVEGQDFLKAKIGELSNLKKEALFLSDERVPLPNYRQYANELVDSMNWSVARKGKIKNEVNKVLDAIDEAYSGSPKNTKEGIELAELDFIKSEQTALSKAYNNKTPFFEYDTHSILGKSARDLIELLTDSTEVKDLNKLIQSHYDAIDLLDALNGKKVHGGAFSKAFLKLGGDVIGVTAGNAVGNPIVGGVTGHIIASKVADIVQNSFITNPVKRILINNLKEQSPKEVTAVLKSLESKYSSIFQDLFPNNESIASPIIKEITTANINPIEIILPEIEGKVNRVIPSVVDTLDKGKRNIFQTIIDRIKKTPKIPNSQGGFIKIPQWQKGEQELSKAKSLSSSNNTTPYKGEKDLTTKILKDLEGKTTVSKQYILDATNRGELKQVERDLIREVLGTQKGDTINVSDFAKKMQLVGEASKYKTANEFADNVGSIKDNYDWGYLDEMRAKKKKGYAVSNSDFNYLSKIEPKLRGKESKTFYRAGEIGKDGDIWLTPQQSGAEQYAQSGGTKVGEYKVAVKNPLILNDLKDIEKVLGRKLDSNSYFANNPDLKEAVINYAKKNGYDGAMFPDSFPDGGSGMESLVVWDKNLVKTKKELVDFYNKVKGKKIPLLSNKK